MQLHGYKTTADVDAFFKSSEAIDAIIRKVGEEFSINKPDELWLNDSIARMNPEPPEKYCTLVCQFSNLTIKAVDIVYLMGMKLVSGREQDLIDVGTVLKNDKNEQPFDLLSKLTSMGFIIDISGLIDAYEKAHGMVWLDDFYVKNEAELRKYF